MTKHINALTVLVKRVFASLEILFYDKLREMADNHRTLRQMLGHGFDDEDKRYPLQTLKDNVSLLTPEILELKKQVRRENAKFRQLCTQRKAA